MGPGDDPSPITKADPEEFNSTWESNRLSSWTNESSTEERAHVSVLRHEARQRTSRIGVHLHIFVLVGDNDGTRRITTTRL